NRVPPDPRCHIPALSRRPPAPALDRQSARWHRGCGRRQRRPCYPSQAALCPSARAPPFLLLRLGTRAQRPAAYSPSTGRAPFATARLLVPLPPERPRRHRPTPSPRRGLLAPG